MMRNSVFGGKKSRLGVSMMSNNGRNSEYFSPTRKSVVLNFDVEENIKMQICISGAAFDIISKN